MSSFLFIDSRVQEVDTLRIDGNAGATVNATDAGSWIQGANQVIGANTYTSYTQGMAMLLIDTDITQNVLP